MSAPTTSDRILLHLKMRGASGARQIADHFEISVMGAHKALNALIENGLVKSFDRVEGRGRPKRLFELNTKGHGRFPDNHSDLTVELINDVEALYGVDGLDRLVARREARQRERYAQAMPSDTAGKVATLARLRASEGYMARTEVADDGAYLLIEDHCPVCAAADACRGFCRSELQVFQAVLGDALQVEREEHLLSGGRRCTYRITPVVPGDGTKTLAGANE